MTEFLVIAATMLIALFFGVVYLAKYADIKHAANQASRYAAFERAFDPTGRIKSDADIERELRVRYFTPYAQVDHDTRATDGRAGRIDLWSQIDGQPLLESPDNATHESQRVADLGGSVIQASLDWGAALFRQTNQGIHRSTVSVPLVEVGHFATDDPRRQLLTIRSATAVGAGSWNASGATEGPNTACRGVGGAVLHDRVLSGFGNLLSSAMGLLEQSPLRWGIVKPDLVPEGSLVRNADLQNWQNVPVEQQTAAADTRC